MTFKFFGVQKRLKGELKMGRRLKLKLKGDEKVPYVYSITDRGEDELGPVDIDELPDGWQYKSLKKLTASVTKQVDGLPPKLAEAVGVRMMDTGCSLAVALTEVTKDLEMSRLWERMT